MMVLDNSYNCKIVNLYFSIHFPFVLLTSLLSIPTFHISCQYSWIETSLEGSPDQEVRWPLRVFPSAPSPLNPPYPPEFPISPPQSHPPMFALKRNGFELFNIPYMTMSPNIAASFGLAPKDPTCSLIVLKGQNLTKEAVDVSNNLCYFMSRVWLSMHYQIIVD